MRKLSDSKATAVTSQSYVGTATAGQTVITPGFTWRTSFSGKALYIDGVKQAPNSYTVNDLGGGVSNAITVSEALIGNETIDFTVLDASPLISLQGIVDSVPKQPTQITNSGFGVWSNGSLESAVSSVNLITNGEEFTGASGTTPPTGWAAGNTPTFLIDTSTFVNGSASLKITGSSFTNMTVPISTVVGRVYKLICWAKVGTSYAAYLGAGTTLASFNAGAPDLRYVYTTSSTFNRLEFIFEAVGTTTHVGVFNDSAASVTAYYDSITLYDMGANLVTNGTFNSGTTGWTAYDSPTTFASVAGGINGNCLQITNNGATCGSGFATFNGLTIGKLYKLGGWVKVGAGSSYIQAGPSGVWNDGTYCNLCTTATSWTYVTASFEATSSQCGVTFLNNSISGATGYFDSITLTEVTVGCVDYNTKALDLWTKDNATCCWRETIDTKEGSLYALRVYNGQVYWSDGSRSSKKEFYYKYAGRPVALGMWVKSSSANKSRFGITDSAGTTWSSYHSGGGTWEWLEVTRTPGTGVASFNVVVDSGTATEARFSQPQLQFGTSVGHGNFVPIPNEFIYFDSILSSKFQTWSGYSSNSYSLSVVADSNGVIPKGVRALKINAKVFDTSSAVTSASFGQVQSGAASFVALSPNTSGYDMKNGVVQCGNDGRLPLAILASGTNTFYLQFWYQGVRL